MIARELAVGGQQLVLQGLRGDLRRRVPAAVRRVPGVQRRVRARGRRGVRRRFRDDRKRGRLDRDPRPRPVDRGRSTPTWSAPGSPGPARPGGSTSCGARPTVIADAGHNPAGRGRHRARRSPRASASTGSSASSRSCEDKDVAGVLDELEPVLSEIVVTTNSSPRAHARRRAGRAGRSTSSARTASTSSRASTTPSRPRWRSPTRRTRSWPARRAAGRRPRRRRRPGDGLRGHGGGRPAAARPGERGRHERQRGLRGEAAGARRHQSKETSSEAAACHRPVHGGASSPCSRSSPLSRLST